MAVRVEDMRVQLRALGEDLARKKALEEKLQSMKRQREALFERKQSLQAILLKEEGDVEKLQRSSPSALFYTLLGKKEERLNKERQEALGAKLKYDAAAGELCAWDGMIAELEEERKGLLGCEKAYEQAFFDLRAVLKTMPHVGEALLELEKKRQLETEQLREVEEALQAGEKAKKQAEIVAAELDEADGYALWDVLGGGILADAIKHSHLDQAQSEAETLMLHLERFRSELADVYTEAALENIALDGFTSFADFFFDGLILDFMVRAHINDSAASVAEIRVQIEKALVKLRSLRKKGQGEVLRLDEQIKALVLGLDL